MTTLPAIALCIQILNTGLSVMDEHPRPLPLSHQELMHRLDATMELLRAQRADPPLTLCSEAWWTRKQVNDVGWWRVGRVNRYELTGHELWGYGHQRHGVVGGAGEGEGGR